MISRLVHGVVALGCEAVGFFPFAIRFCSVAMCFWVNASYGFSEPLVFWAILLTRIEVITLYLGKRNEE